MPSYRNKTPMTVGFKKQWDYNTCTKQKKTVPKQPHAAPLDTCFNHRSKL